MLSPDTNAETLNRIRVQTYPTTLIGLPQGKIVEHRNGYQPAGEIKSLLRNIKAKALGR
jgi:protein disulfide-isomerase